MGLAEIEELNPVLDVTRIHAPGEEAQGAPPEVDRVLVQPRPGVMDPVAHAVEDVLVRNGMLPAGEGAAPEVATYHAYEIESELEEAQLAEAARRLFANETIEICRVNRGDLLYATGSAGLAPGGYERLRSLSRTMVDYPETDIIVKGHTDSVGSESLNQDLSERRAENVQNFLAVEGVSGARVRAFGFGESLPVATNATPEGRQQNRRVEIELRPNASLRERAALQGGSTY